MLEVTKKVQLTLNLNVGNLDKICRDKIYSICKRFCTIAFIWRFHKISQKAKFLNFVYAMKAYVMVIVRLAVSL